MAKKLNDVYIDVVVSEGTLREEDLIDNIEDFNSLIRDKHIRNLIEEFNLSLDDYIIDDIIDYLNEIAPEGCYFGTHNGDGALFGFFQYQN